MGWGGGSASVSAEGVSSSRARWRRLSGCSRTQRCELLTVRWPWHGRPPGPWVGEASPHVLLPSSQSEGPTGRQAPGVEECGGSFAAPSLLLADRLLLELRAEGPGLQVAQVAPSTRRPALWTVTAESPGELLGRWVTSIIICQVEIKNQLFI